MPSIKQDPNSQDRSDNDSIIHNHKIPERKNKRALLLELIRRQGGATLDEITSATGWLPHTARAAITGLRKRGQDVRRERTEGISRYILGSGGE